MALALVVVLALSVGTSGAVPLGDPRQEREENRQKQAELAADIDVLEASVDEVNDALDALQVQVDAELAKLAEAQRAADDAAAALETARIEERRAEEAVAEMQRAVEELAVSVYVNPPGGGVVETLEADDLSQAVLKQTYIAVRANNDFDVLDQLSKAQDDLESRREAAEEIASQAQEALAEVDARVATVATARDQQASKAAEAEDRLDHLLGEQAILAENGEKLDAEVAAADAAALAAKLREQAPPAPNGPVGAPPPGNISLRTVRGITVASSIADDLEALLIAAEADGVPLSGWGYRDNSRQIELRKKNCGTSEYAIYHMPPSQCRPPTARPGQSMHERGLAIDFTYQGRTIQSRSSPAYQWMAANASRYGLYNLPSEPWHWSTNGN